MLVPPSCRGGRRLGAPRADPRQEESGMALQLGHVHIKTREEVDWAFVDKYRIRP